jgi:hypothetical protein
MNNAYPELPQLPFQRTSVVMADVVASLNRQAVDVAIRRAGYVMFRNESGNGAKGINNNYIGAQADGQRWPAFLTPSFAGTVTLAENGTNIQRIFLAFNDLDGCIAFLMNRVSSRGLFIGGTTHLVLTMPVTSPNDLAVAYHREWVTGSATSDPSADELASFLSMYGQATTLIT